MKIHIKKIAALITAAVTFALCGVLVASASQYVDDDKLYSSKNGEMIYISSDKFLYRFDGEVPGVTICGYAGKQTDITIPEKINGRTVSAIADNTLADNDKITSLTLPDCITAIGDGSFNGCDNLETITLTGSVQILENVFCDCPKLQSVTFPYGISEINDSFSGCTSLSRVKFSRSVSKLGDGSFNGCSSLAAIEWSTGLSYLGDVFDGNTVLTTIHIPKGIVIIDGAFDNCTAVETLELPDSLLYINSGFNGCSKLKNLTFPDGLLYIGNSFGNCSSLEKVILPSGTEADENAFANCDKISLQKESNAWQIVIIAVAAVLFVCCIVYTLRKTMKNPNTNKKTKRPTK